MVYETPGKRMAEVRQPSDDSAFGARQRPSIFSTYIHGGHVRQYRNLIVICVDDASYTQDPHRLWRLIGYGARMCNTLFGCGVGEHDEDGLD